MAQDTTGALVLAPRLDAAARARRHVRGLLQGWGLDALLDPVMLLTSEVVTNALLHSGTPVTVRVERDGPGVRLSVEDGSAVPPVSRQRSTTATTGRGVQLLEAVADDWGWQATSAGKQVWFRVLGEAGWRRAAERGASSEADR